MKAIQSGSRGARVMVVAESPGMLLSTLPPFLRDRIKIADDGCWIWTKLNGKPMGSHRYGQIWLHGRNYQAHIIVYETLIDEIPTGLQPDHLCEIKSCVNPRHIEIVTQSVNSKRGSSWHHVVEKWQEATHCQRGHEFIPNNIMLKKDGRRRCRECQRYHVRNHRQKQRALLLALLNEELT